MRPRDSRLRWYGFLCRLHFHVVNDSCVLNQYSNQRCMCNWKVQYICTELRLCSAFCIILVSRTEAGNSKKVKGDGQSKVILLLFP